MAIQIKRPPHEKQKAPFKQRTLAFLFVLATVRLLWIQFETATRADGPLSYSVGWSASTTPSVSEERKQSFSAAPPPLSKYDSWSACILVNDENVRLHEWLAYHYYAANLRYVVIAVDPNSLRSPKPVLERFGPYIEFVEWGDADFGDAEYFRIKDTDTPERIVQLHRNRQNNFYTGCIKHMMSMNRTYTMFHDVGSRASTKLCQQRNGCFSF